MNIEHSGWTRYHIIYTPRHQWKFYREGMRKSIITHSDRNKIIKEALYTMCSQGGLLTVHNKDATIDFIVDNWIG